jgi:hypothetical protein
MFTEPIEDRAAVMESHPHTGMTLQYFDERQIGFLVGLLEDVVEVADRLVVVDGEG